MFPGLSYLDKWPKLLVDSGEHGLVSQTSFPFLHSGGGSGVEPDQLSRDSLQGFVSLESANGCFKRGLLAEQRSVSGGVVDGC